MNKPILISPVFADFTSLKNTTASVSYQDRVYSVLKTPSTSGQYRLDWAFGAHMKTAMDIPRSAVPSAVVACLLAEIHVYI